MKKRKQPYRIADDGLPARIVGDWVTRKSFYHGRYAHMFATGMRRKWPRRCYIELFAGPGLSWDRGGKQFVKGSALVGMGEPFTDFFFVDNDSTAIAALRQRAEAEARGRGLWIEKLDCNAAVDEIVKRIPRGAINLVFVDPTAAQVNFQTIAKLAAVPHTDLLFTFHVSAFLRARDSKAKEIDAFFPPGADWRGAASRLREERIPELLRVYLQGLEPFGYRQDWAGWVPVRQSKRALMYILVLFTANPRGQDFWQKTIDVEDTGQGRLFGLL